MSEIDSIIETLKAELVAKFDAAYQQGFAAGAEDMRSRILNAAQGPVVVPQADAAAPAVAVSRPAVVQNNRVSDRAPKGAVGRMLARILTEHPGSSVGAIEDLAPRYDPSVALKSIGNTLRRFENVKYRREAFDRWFLMVDDNLSDQLETAEEASPAAPNVFS